MAAINPWASWGTFTEQSWGMAAADPWASWALCPQDSAWPMEGSHGEERMAARLPAAPVQVIAVNSVPTEAGKDKCEEPLP
ncbi:zinc finger protein 606 isoform X3 [Ochotona princeps]|uniref:zinc finger protein 606 isoform X3 n=1 Tax=Ochotona princeps TaxID=9978 RepID=UPI002715116F|nr:zinc finger protein 606 isoform X3 [Ochotona princeps]